MQKLSVTLVLILFSFFAISQQAGNYKITGNISDSISSKPIEYATITVLQQGDKKRITGTTTNVSGNFIIDGLNEGAYKIVIEFVGYKPLTLNNIVVNKTSYNINLKHLLLSKKQTMLQDVTVVAPRGLIENKIDKIVFNAEKDLTSQGGVATDVLKKVPQVSVDIDGNVELAGNSSIRFLINGKPSSAFGSSITDVLQSIPANQIKSVEVITNPGAKYDAQGLGGIINIILKKSNVSGINGNLSLTAGTRIENGSFNLNAKKEKFSVNAFVSGNARLSSLTPSTSNRLSNDTLAKTNTQLYQQGNYRFKRHGYQTGMGFDWAYNKKNSLSGSLSYNNFDNSGVGLTDQSIIKKEVSTGNIFSDISSINNTQNSFLFYNVDASLNYKKTFNKEDQELEISINTSKGNNHTRLANNQRLEPQDSLYYGTQSNNPATEHQTEIKLDYTQPIKKNINWGIGSKLNLADINSSSNIYRFKPSTKDYLFDNSLSNHLTYNQKVYAFYSELSFPVAKVFDAKIGGRYERTIISSFFSNAQQQLNQRGYNTFVPSIFFSKKINEEQTIKLSYSKRIQRPNYEDLNPFVNTNDPKNISAGNPYLLPEIGHRFELSYSRNLQKIGSYMINAFYRINDQDIQPYIVYYPTLKVGDSTFTNVALSTKQNIGSERNAGINLFADLHVTKKLNIRSNWFMFQRHTINALNPGFSVNSFNYRLNINAGYQFTTTLAGEFFGNFNSARNEVQGKYPSFTSYSLALRKQFWGKKGSLALTTSNPFNKYVNQRTSLYGPNFTVNNLRQVPFRSIGINFTWKFGKLEFKKEKENDNNLNTPAE